ncbi:Conserved_hypothetical protein [Hexamita inflata]|uniref:Uncharacterized protein n=1 Tax=Hexamita inflata TaxID=28002 RepID=A0AA86PIB8_9EUKA|nr:Conserved hypothetical protein [Hexamita inflata]
MFQANQYKQQIAKLILPQQPDLSKWHVDHLKSCLEFIQQTNTSQEILVIIQTVKAAPQTYARVDLNMFTETEQHILMNISNILVGDFHTEWSANGLGNLQSQLQTFRDQSQPATTNNYFEQKDLLQLLQFNYFKTQCEVILQVETDKVLSPTIDYYENTFIQTMQQHFKNINATKIGRDLKMDEFAQFDFNKQYPRDYCKQLDKLFKDNFKLFYFAPSVLFLEKLVSKVSEYKMGLINFMCQEQYVGDDKEYVPLFQVQTEGIIQAANKILENIPYDITVTRFFDTFKRVDTKSTLQSFQSMIKQLEMKLQTLKQSQLQSEVIIELMEILKVADESTFRNMIELLHELANKIKSAHQESILTKFESQNQQKVESKPEPTITQLLHLKENDLKVMTHEELTYYYMCLQAQFVQYKK